MSAHVLFNLLSELGKNIKCEAYRAFYLFFTTSLINSIKQDHECYFYLLYDWRESCLLIGPICFHKSLCLPENWSELAQKVI